MGPTTRRVVGSASILPAPPSQPPSPMPDILRQVQNALYLAAGSVNVWRDFGVMLLAALVIALLYYAAEAS